jgi:hypothetical protein
MRIATVVFAAVAVLSLTICTAAQSVADAAKQPKPAKKAAKVYTNDDIPSVDTPKDDPAPASAKPSDATKPDAKDAEGDKKEATPEDARKAEDEFKARVATQKQKISDIERELQLTDREYKLRAAVFYADAGNRLRDDRKWADSERKYKSDMARLQQDLTDNKQKLEDLREAARKAGIKAE